MNRPIELPSLSVTRDHGANARAAAARLSLRLLSLASGQRTIAFGVALEGFLAFVPLDGDFLVRQRVALVVDQDGVDVQRHLHLGEVARPAADDRGRQLDRLQQIDLAVDEEVLVVGFENLERERRRSVSGSKEVAIEAVIAVLERLVDDAGVGEAGAVVVLGDRPCRRGIPVSGTGRASCRTCRREIRSSV